MEASFSGGDITSNGGVQLLSLGHTNITTTVGYIEPGCPPSAP